MQQFRLNLAYQNLIAILHQLKIGKLNTKELERMRRLEASVQNLGHAPDGKVIGMNGSTQTSIWLVSVACWWDAFEWNGRAERRTASKNLSPANRQPA